MNTASATATLPASDERSGPAGTSAFRATMGCEWRLVRGDVGWWAAVVVLAGCVAYALHNGRVRLDDRARAVVEAGRDEARRLKGLTDLLGKIERGEAKAPEAPYRDPRNAIYVGRGQGAALAYLPDAPLAVAAVGLSDLYPQVLRVAAGSKDGFLFVDEVANPADLLNGTFDLAFVLVYIYPLLILAVAYNVLSGEREQGTLALIAASSAPLTRVLLGKLAVRVGGLVAAATLTLYTGLAVTAPSAFQRGGLAGLAALTLGIGLYGAFWAGLALLVNSLRRDSAFNAAALVMAWVVLLLLAPATINAAAQVLYPAPARSEMVQAVREASIDAERDRDAVEARYREEHRGVGGLAADPRGVGGDDRTRRTLAVALAADARADAVLADQEARVKQQRHLCERLAYLAPPVLFHDAVVELAGNGHSRWDDYLARVGDFHTTWKAFFVDRAERNAGLTAADYAAFPRFPTSAPGASLPSEGVVRIASALSFVGLAAVALFLWAGRRLSRAGG